MAAAPAPRQVWGNDLSSVNTAGDSSNTQPPRSDHSIHQGTKPVSTSRHIQNLKARGLHSSTTSCHVPTWPDTTPTPKHLFESNAGPGYSAKNTPKAPGLTHSYSHVPMKASESPCDPPPLPPSGTVPQLALSPWASSPAGTLQPWALHWPLPSSMGRESLSLTSAQSSTSQWGLPFPPCAADPSPSPAPPSHLILSTLSFPMPSF